MKAHASSEFHVRQVEAELLANRRETVVHQLQRFGDSERSKNWKAIKALPCCICKQHIPHTTKLIELIASCGGKDLEFLSVRQQRMHLTLQQMLSLILLKQ